MARGATKRNQKVRAAQTAAPKRKPSRGARRQTSHSYEEAMFFPKLRNHAKWVFVFLAIVFALGFVVFGVGSGTGSFGLGDLFNSNGNTGNGPSASAAKKKIAENPKDAAAWHELATASLTSGDTATAINAFNHYTQLKPKSTAGFLQLASLYQQRAVNLQKSIANAQAQQSTLTPNPVLEPQALSPGTKKQPGQPFLGTPIINSTLSTIYSTKLQNLQTKQKAIVSKAEAAYQNIAQLQPRNAQVQLQLGSFAQQFNDIPTATLALKRYLILAPHSAEAPLVRKQLKLFQASSQLTQLQPQGG